MTKDFLNHTCDCGVKEGQLHKLGCDMERCPFCGNQLITCMCAYEQLGLVNHKKYPKTEGLPPKIYSNGLTDGFQNRWEYILNKKGRIPYIILPNFCRRCLKSYPNMFKVPDKEWNKLPIGLRKYVLCRNCYDKIIKWIQKVK